MNEAIIRIWMAVIFNFIAVILYLIWNLPIKKNQNKPNVWMRAMVMLLCPVIGGVFFLVSHILFSVFFSNPVDLEDVIFSKERIKTALPADEENERNMVPLEEAIEVTETEELRGLMMNVVRGDISHSLATIALALNSADTETAHYAASVLQDAINEFRSTVQKEYALLQKSEEGKVELAGVLLDYMNQVLEQRVLADVEQVYYVNLMNEIGEILYEEKRGKMTSKQFEAVTLRLLEIEAYEECAKWCERAEYRYPNTLSTYTCLLKLYFNTGQRERFFSVMEDLKESSILIDNETLELIRVFQ